METHPYIDTNGLLSQLNLTSEQVERDGFQVGGIWFKDTKTIMCGTFPPTKEYKDRKGYIHYSSPRNKFWRHIDNIYDTKLYIPTKISKNEIYRIQNSLSKISFLKEKKVGLVDIFTKVLRKKEGSANDTDLIPHGTIFENEIFNKIIQQEAVQQIGFVYSLSRDIFEKEISYRFGKTPKILRKYNTDNVPLEVKKVTINNKELLLAYSPIHGNILDELKRKALKKVIEFDTYATEIVWQF